MSSDYRRVEQAIEFLRLNRKQQPGLGEVAGAMGVSPAYCQKLFRRYAGISPKRFLQYLTLDYAKLLLLDSRPVLDAALESGLSGPSRLHDHFVSLDAITPGEFKTKGAGLDIAYGVHPSPFGNVLLAATQRGICHLAFIGDLSPESELDRLARRWPNAHLSSRPSTTGEIVEDIFRCYGRPVGEFNLQIKGSNFQCQVWQALLNIPPGRVASYKRIANALHRPTAVRAVANAVGANSIAWLIPCHRVLRNNGDPGGYRWGSVRKQAMLAWERAKLLP